MKDFAIQLPSNVEMIINMLYERGFSAHVVGGAVRDSLIGRELGDFDITTDATPEQTKAVFSAYKTVDTGIKHGTVTVVIDHTPYEITTYRIDGNYKDNRHPDSVTFTPILAEDLKRRDFTVNAMAYNHGDGLTDLFEGIRDIELKVIRAVGDPYVRFNEDALRILRALRFASVLDFDIESDTAKAALELKDLLTNVSGERIYAELKKLIAGTAASRIMKKYAAVLSVALGGVTVEKYPDDSELSGVDILTRLCAVFLLNSEAPADDAAHALEALKTDNSTCSYTESVLRAYGSADFKDRISVLHMLRNHGEDITHGILKLGTLVGRFSDAEKDLFSLVMASDPVYKISQLKIGGHELMTLGYKGRAVGDALSRLLTAVIDEKCENTEKSLKAFLTK